jgi:hypothetical protein
VFVVSVFQRLARLLFNEARQAEKNDNNMVMVRKYQLLESERFKDTKAYTEYLDRQERLDYQKLQTEREQRLAQQVDTLRDAVVTTMKSEHAALRQALQAHGQALTQEIRLQGKRLEDAILAYQQWRQQQDEAIYQRINANQQHTQQQISQVYNEMGNALGQVQYQMNAQVGAISHAIQSQTQAIQQAAQEANYQQQALFNRAQEAQSMQNYQNRKCAEELARNGKYGFWSSCP